MEIYLSPVRLLKYQVNPNFADEKKRVMEELYQSENQELLIEGVKYSQKDIERSFELLTNTDNYKFHMAYENGLPDTIAVKAKFVL